MTRRDVVTDPTVIAKLPKASWAFNFHKWWFGYYFQTPRSQRQFMFYGRMRVANAETIHLGPFHIVRPMPWLLGPAQALHPEAFR